MQADVRFAQHIRAIEKATRRETIRIANPLPGGAQRLKLDVAFRHVRRGAAEWVDGGRAIRFTGEAVARLVRAVEADRAVHRTRGTFEQIHGLPITKPMDLLAPVRKRNFWNRKGVWADGRSSPQRTRRK